MERYTWHVNAVRHQLKVELKQKSIYKITVVDYKIYNTWDYYAML